jgi:hypothetical protein
MKIVKTIGALLAMLVLACSARAADQAPASSVDLWTVRQNLNNAITLSEQSGQDSQHNVDLLIDQTLHLLRSPLAGGQGYRFATMNRDKADTFLLASSKVDAVLEDGQFLKLAGEVATPIELEIFSPLQRAAFKNNGDTYIKSYRVELVIDGAKQTVERKFEDWLRRGTSHIVPLPGVAQWARIEIQVAANRADKSHAIIKLRARVPEITDDPMNPYTFSIDELKTAREYNRLEAKRGVVREKLKSALTGLDVVPGSATQAPSAIDVDQLVDELDQVLFLMGGSDAEKSEASAKLSQIINVLKQKN